MKSKITFEIDTERLSSKTDTYLATCWHLAQANPADLYDRDAGELAELIGREIISRWLKGVPPELWSHQGRHHFWGILQKHGSWMPVDGDGEKREWVPSSSTFPELIDACSAAQCDCTPAQRDSGHKSECWFPRMETALSKAINREAKA